MTRLQRHPDGSITLCTEAAVRVSAGASMLDAEDQLMAALNQAGAGLTGELLSSLDADGRPLTGQDGGTLTAKRGKEARHVETPYGCVVVERWACQSSDGGACHYPLDTAAGLIGAATPKFARMISRKMVELPAAEGRSHGWPMPSRAP